MRDRLVGRRAQLAAQARRRGRRRRRSRSCRRITAKPRPATSARRLVGARVGATQRAISPWLLSGDGLRAMSEMLMPARPSVSAMSAMTPGRLGTATRSSLVGPRPQPGLDQRAAPGRRPGPARRVRSAPRAQLRADRPRARRWRRRARRPARRGWPRRCRPTAPGWRRRRASRRGSSGRWPAGARRRARRAPAADEDVGHDVRQVADGGHHAVVDVGVDRPRAARRGR